MEPKITSAAPSAGMSAGTSTSGTSASGTSASGTSASGTSAGTSAATAPTLQWLIQRSELARAAYMKKHPNATPRRSKYQHPEVKARAREEAGAIATEELDRREKQKQRWQQQQEEEQRQHQEQQQKLLQRQRQEEQRHQANLQLQQHRDKKKEASLIRQVGLVSKQAELMSKRLDRQERLVSKQSGLVSKQSELTSKRLHRLEDLVSKHMDHENDFRRSMTSTVTNPTSTSEDTSEHAKRTNPTSTSKDTSEHAKRSNPTSTSKDASEHAKHTNPTSTSEDTSEHAKRTNPTSTSKDTSEHAKHTNPTSTSEDTSEHAKRTSLSPSQHGDSNSHPSNTSHPSQGDNAASVVESQSAVPSMSNTFQNGSAALSQGMLRLTSQPGAGSDETAHSDLRSRKRARTDLDRVDDDRRVDDHRMDYEYTEESTDGYTNPPSQKQKKDLSPCTQTKLHMLQAEKESTSFANPDYMDGQPRFTEHWRSRMICAMIEVHHCLGLSQDTLHLAVSLVDRFLSTIVVPDKNKLPLLVVSCLLISSKFADLTCKSLKPSDLAKIGDIGYSVEDIRAGETEVLRVLQYRINVPTVVSFLPWLINADTTANPRARQLAFYFADSTLLSYDNLCLFPSQLAAGAHFLARSEAGQQGWSHAMSQLRYSEKEVERFALTIRRRMETNKNTVMGIKHHYGI